VQFTTNANAVTPIQSDDSDGKGCQQQRLTVIPFPIPVDSRRSYEVVGQHWNVAATSSIASSNYVSIPIPGIEGTAGKMKIKIAVPSDGSRVFVVADISRVQHSNGWTNSRFQLSVDGMPIGYTNTGEHYGWQYSGVSVRAASGSLKAGQHTIELQAATQRGRLYFLSDGNGFQQRRLSAIVVPPKRLFNKNFNLGTAWKQSSEWSNLPGADMAMTLTTDSAGQLFINAAINRVQSWGTANVEFRLLLSSEGDDAAGGKEIARTNTGQINGWRFHDVAFHGTTALIGPGTHTVRVQFKAKTGNVVFYNDGNGYQQRRLSAILFPPATIEHVKQNGVCHSPKKSDAEF